MRRRVHATLLLTFVAVFLFLSSSIHLSRNAISSQFFPSPSLTTRPVNPDLLRYALIQDGNGVVHHNRRVSSLDNSIVTVAILLPDWEILVIVHGRETNSTPPPTESPQGYVCLFHNNATSPARFSGIFPESNRMTFKCLMPNCVRRRRPFLQPILTSNTGKKTGRIPMPELFRWTFLTYDSLSTENDVVLFVKGVNNRQGINRSPSEFRCVFYDDSNNIAVKTAVTTSAQEVFRCPHPDLTALTTLGDGKHTKISLEILDRNLVVPSVAHYIPRRSLAPNKRKSLLCACTMIHNSGKFLKEWVMYHSKIGVDKFILYDNDSNDDLNSVVLELTKKGYDVTTSFWIWPKTQEAGFSHSVIYARDSCKWMLYVDIDEFVFSPLWVNSSQPSDQMLKSLLPRVASRRPIGQVSINCNEFGPSGQRTHPKEGVIQGYTCRKKIEQRHKSMVLLEAVDPSLLNVIHHFHLRSEYRTKQMGLERAVVNHYKYQAWPEFRNKFRRRVSAYVVDWKDKFNPSSKDRTPGLGFQPVEPKGWAEMFCEVRDERLKLLTKKMV
ncbi:hypothetical protein UlMin_033925 [Ulmus minor]